MFELIYLNGYYMIYPNFPGEASFSTNHMEIGAHISRWSVHKKEDYTVPLMAAPQKHLLIDLPTPDLATLPLLNLFGEPYSTIDTLKSTPKWRHAKVRYVR